MRHIQWKAILFSITTLASIDHACAASDTTLTLSDATMGPAVHALSQLTDHKAVATVDALIQNAVDDNAMIMLSVESTNDIERARSIVERAFDARVDLFIEGSPAMVAAVQPKTSRVWKRGERLFLSNRSERRGTILQSFDITLTPYRLKTDMVELRATIDRDTAIDVAAGRTRRAADGPSTPVLNSASPSPRDQSGSFELPSLIAKTPSEVCIAIRNKLVASLSNAHLSDAELRRAVNRVCQYGTIGEFFATPADATSGAPSNGNPIVLNISQEWMLLKSEDTSQPDKSSLYLWVRTLGDDAGSGLTHQKPGASVAYGSPTRVTMLNIMSPQIASGWGPTHSLAKASSRSSPVDDMFECETNPNQTDTTQSPPVTIGCPIRPRLLSVLPADSLDDTVTIANATTWSIGVSYSLLASNPPALSLGANVGRSDTQTATETLHMVRTSTDANTAMYRRTEWAPNWEAMAKWIRAKGAKDRTVIPLDGSSPLASVLNPEWSAVWRLPLAANAGRKTLYTSVFEAHDVGCVWNIKAVRCENPVSPAWGIWSKDSSMIVAIDDFGG